MSALPASEVGTRPDPAAALQFLKALDPNAAAFNFRSFPECGGAGARRHDNVPLSRIPALMDECAAQRHGLFVVVNAGGQRGHEIAACRAVFLDIDAKTFANREDCDAAMRFAHEGRRSITEPVPLGWPHASAIVQSGGGGWHVWWFVDDLPRANFTAVQKALARRFVGDQAVCDLARVMRLPGSIHFKEAPTSVVVKSFKPERRYELVDLLRRLGVEVPENAPTSDLGEDLCDAEPERDAVLAYLRHHRQYLKPGGRLGTSSPVDVVCPNAPQHSTPDAVTSTVYMPHGLHGRPRGFHCSHAHCTHLGLRDFLSSIRYEADCPPLEADDAVACRFVSWLDGRAMYARSHWHLFKGGHWKPDKNAIERLLKDFVRKLRDDMADEYAASIKSGDEGSTKTAARRLRAATSFLNHRKQQDVLAAAAVMLNRDAATLDRHHDLLCVPNGSVDLKTGALQPPDPTQGFTMCAGVAYDPAAEAPRFELFIREVFPEPDVAAYIQRWAGYVLTGHMREDVLAVWYGQGANGKSVLMDVLAQVFGDYAISAEPSLLVGKAHAAGAASPDVARLAGRRLCYVNESKVGDRLNDGQVKRLVSTEKVTARGLYRDPFEFYPTAKVVLRTNNKPVVDDSSDGIWRRLHLLPFAQQFSGPKRDEDLLDKLKAELPGILTWCVRGAVEWYAKRLAPPAVVRAATDAYRADSDDVAEWIDARVEEGGFTSTSDLLADYARHAGLRFPPSAKRFNATLKGRGYKATRTSAGKGFCLTLRRGVGCEFV